MTINPEDIKLLASERMTDTSDGGGRRTGTVIPDGVAGNLFPKISRLDSVYGRVNLRKVYGHVDTANLDTYAGAHAVLIDAPDDDRIHATLFSTASEFDDRTAARDRIESYVVAGPQSRMVLYGRQLVGQQAFTVLQRVEEALPDVGSVYCLSNEPGGVVTTQQFVRVEDVVHEVRTFTDQAGDFQKRVITLKISTPLRYEFVGAEEARRTTIFGTLALVRTTTVADASRYCGTAKTTADAAEDALEVFVSSVYAPIVPTTQREVPIVTADIARSGNLVAAGTVRVPARAVGARFEPAGMAYVAQRTCDLGTPIMPGTLRLYLAVDGTPGAPLTANVDDDGAGGIPASAPASTRLLGGTVDYESGVVTVSAQWADALYGGRIYAQYVVACAAEQPAHTIELPVTLATRGTVLVQTLSPLPARGSTYVDYRALGKWYRLRDDGTGVMGGDDAAYGSGTVDYVTGAVVITLGALPDVGSSSIIGWASPTHYTVRAGGTSDASAEVHQLLQLSLGENPVKPGTLSIEYVANGVTYTGSANISGVISGGGLAGRVNHQTGEVDVRYTTRFPDYDSVVSLEWDELQPTDAETQPTVTSGTAAVVGDFSFDTMPNVVAGGLTVKIPFTYPRTSPSGVVSPVTMYIQAADDGLGAIKTFTSLGEGYTHVGNETVGSVNYATGEVTLTGSLHLQMASYQPKYQLGPGTAAGWATVSSSFAMQAGNYAWTVRLDNPNTESARTQDFAVEDSPLMVDMTATTGEAIVPGSLYFTVLGKAYQDRSGVLYTDIQPDNTGTMAGTVDYATGVVSFTLYGNDYTKWLTLHACLTRRGLFTAVGATFRTAGSPLRPASTIIQVVAADGEALTATADTNGDFGGETVRGSVNQQMGVVSIEWGELVVAAGNETEPWYDADLVEGGMIWRPRAVLPGTLRYSTVVLSALPVNATILGLDPVRLPSDGRVPIFRPGDVVVVHNTKVTALPNPAVAGSTYAMPRGNLADLVLYDLEGTRVDADQYTVDLDAGEVTMAGVLDLAGLVQPLQARHRIEEMNLAADVQINGQISLSSPLTRAYDDSDTWVSSALLFGDLFARVSNVFDQITWTGVWSDTRIGDDAAAAYNTVAHPIEVENSGAVTERWRIHFTSGAGAFQVIGERAGVIATGSTAADCAPVNPLTGEPYFVIRSAGWGLGWSAGNQLRFNTIGATAPIWVVRTVLPGATLAGDSLDLQLRGDVDA